MQKTWKIPYSWIKINIPLHTCWNGQNLDCCLTSNASKDVEQELSFISGENAKCTTTFENSLAVSYKTKHTLTMWHSSLATWYLTKGIENIYWHKKKLCTDVYNNFILNCQKLETRCPLEGEWINKLVYPEDRILFSIKVIWAIKPWKDLERKLLCLLLSERSQSENATYCMIPTMWHSGKGKTKETVKRWVV